MAYNFLPGFEVSVRDGGLVVPRPDFETGSLLIIGPQDPASSEDQRVSPMWIGGQDAFRDNIGSTTASNPLYQAWKQAIDAGCNDVRVLELCGTDTDTQYENLHQIYLHLEDYEVDAVVVTGIYADDLVIDPTLPEGTEVDYVMHVPATFEKVEDEELGTGDGTQVEFQLQNAPVAREDLFVYLDGTATTAYTIDYLTGDVALDEAPGEGVNITASYNHAKRGIAGQLAGFCKVVSSRVSQTLGFVALAPASDNDLVTIRQYVNGLETQKFDGLLQVVAGPQVRFSVQDGSTYPSSGIAAYAAQTVMLPAQSSPTNKVLPGAGSLTYNLSPAQLNELCSKNIVTFRTKAGRIVVTDAVTTAGQESDLTRLTTMRIVNEAVQSVRTVADPFIGEPNETPQRTALNTAIRSALDAMVQAGALRSFRFSMSSSLQDFISGRMQIDLELVPAFELRKITTTVSLRPSL